MAGINFNEQKVLTDGEVDELTQAAPSFGYEVQDTRSLVGGQTVRLFRPSGESLRFAAMIRKPLNVAATYVGPGPDGRQRYGSWVISPADDSSPEQLTVYRGLLSQVLT